MSEMRERVHEFQSALKRYLKDNSLRDAGAPLLGALYDLRRQMNELEFPEILAAYQVQEDAPASFFRSQWPIGILIPASKMWIHLKGDVNGLMPSANLIQSRGSLYLHIVDISRHTEKALTLLREQPFLRPVPRSQNWKLEPLTISESSETSLEDLFKN